VYAALDVELLPELRDKVAELLENSGKSSIAQEEFAAVRDSVERTFRQVAADKELEFEISVAPELPAAIETDGKRLQQVLTNLLSNAFKFTARGSVRLAIGPADEGWTPGHAVLDRADGVVAFSVIDTGIGIPPNKQRLIFEAFQQADGTTSREYGGTGLGLSISRELARLLGGEIRVSSTPGQGSTFTLYLPLAHYPSDELRHGGDYLRPPVAALPTALIEPPREEPRQESKAEGGLAGRSVLVVDDDIRNVFALTSALEARGLRVVHAESGKEGIELLKRANHGDAPGVDAVLMDVMMPGLDGHDTMRIVRQIDGCRELPILAVTAKAMVGDREKCIEAGANDYLAKPVDIDELLSKLQRLIPDGD
jgi:CheY-like chemotaxis protein/two-component sensor histidine kinase